MRWQKWAQGQWVARLITLILSSSFIHSCVNCWIESTFVCLSEFGRTPKPGSSSERQSLFLAVLWLNTLFAFIQEVILCRISCVQKHVSCRKLFWHGNILCCAVMFNACHHCAVPRAEPSAPAAFHRGVFGYLAAAPGQSHPGKIRISAINCSRSQYAIGRLPWQK